MSRFRTDVIVIGSGPAGSTAATLLAQYGHGVTIVERATHPRFHIGESLLPMGAPVLERLGIHLDDSDYLPKSGAEFIDERSGQRCRFPLAVQFQAHQVERAKFDQLMVENAIDKGARLRQGETVRSVSIDQQQVTVVTDKEILTARYLIDASGRSSFMGRMSQGISRIDNLGQFSLYTHYSNVNAEAAEALYETGDVQILMLDIGWFWIIPLSGRRLSLGLVVKDKEGLALRGAALFRHYVDASPLLSELLMGAEQESDICSEADFSFCNECRFGERYACCGDAAGFLDPVFSSGVLIAVTSAERVADRLHVGFTEGREADAELHAEDDQDYVLGFQSMLLLVERFYRSNLVQNLFFESARDDSIKEQIAGLLAGDLWSGKNAFQQQLLNSRRYSTGRGT